jgi:hypothetical protein
MARNEVDEIRPPRCTWIPGRISLALGVGSDAVVETNVSGIAIEGGVSILHGKLGVQVGGLRDKIATLRQG